ncbi:MAG: YbaB/EbfC family nucleoid-associated protein [Firmicutes bacterium]|nr:YbaB/EbfC family nucleoid-associated protein [Bacillota bacterium]MBQ7242395.1 YbaB/EbfC family nucleoid-associated protein [Bacillota bacterium]MBR0105293.1 YbaB/EbfC family nucleoid-associated protein [Bacillota bacterium]MBR2593263.1 YbaB/EbfC family nucleoid-associated protein [Bacillota bacterium]
MAKGGYGNFGGMNMNNLMKQAQRMQRQLEESKAALEEEKFEITSGGGAVKAVVSGKKELLEIKIDPEVVDPDDVEMLEDLILSAVNEAMRMADERYKEVMGKFAGAMGL